MSSPSRQGRHFPRRCCPGSSCLGCWNYRSSSSDASRLYQRSRGNKLRMAGYILSMTAAGEGGLCVFFLVIRVLVALTDTREEIPQGNAVINIPTITIVSILPSSLFFLLLCTFLVRLSCIFRTSCKIIKGGSINPSSSCSFLRHCTLNCGEKKVIFESFPLRI